MQLLADVLIGAAVVGLIFANRIQRICFAAFCALVAASHFAGAAP